VAEDLARHLRAATTTLLAGAGHWPQIDQPDEVARALLSIGPGGEGGPGGGDPAAKRLPGLIRDLRLVAVEGGPHHIGWTHPDEVNTALLEFLGD
jgi:pimeloyl-ACP methyl ester carboxylesterase